MVMQTAWDRHEPGRRASCQRMVLAGQGGQRGCYLGKARADVGCHGLSSPAVLLVPGVGLSDREAEMALDPGQGRVADPVGADLLGRDPGEMTSEPLPEVVV